jgi:hypothetical protein
VTDDWTRRAEREAAAILDRVSPESFTPRGHLLDLLAVAWLQGVNVGSHETLAAVEVGFEEMQARL